MSAEASSAAGANVGASLGALGASLLALIAVVALILLLAWMLRRMPGFGQARSHGELRIVASLAVGVRERVMVIAAGDQQMLIGVTAENIRLLQTLDTPINETPPPDFRQWLSKARGGGSA